MLQQQNSKNDNLTVNINGKIHHCNLLQSILAKIQANVTGMDDALMLDLRGFVAETNATHVFLVHRGTVLTSHETACPEGITQATVPSLCQAHGVPYREKDLSFTEVYRADEMFCTGRLGELAPVVKVDDRTIGGGVAGTITLRLTELFRRLTECEGMLVVENSD